MAKKKKEKSVLPDLDLETEFESLNAEDIKLIAEQELSPSQLNILKKISYYISVVGLDLPDACILTGVNYDLFKKDMEIHPIIKRVMVVKELEYTSSLLATISAKGRSDDKTAQWLLERKDPDKYAAKKAGVVEDESIVIEALRFVRETEYETETGNPLIKKESGQALIIQKSQGPKKFSTQELLGRVHEIADANAN